MKNIYAISIYTLKEALSKKIFITFFILSALVLVGMGLFIGFSSFNDMPIVMNGKELTREEGLEIIIKGFQAGLVVPLFGLGIFLSVFSTAGFIPSMLEKGNIDLFLSKPISRAQLLSGKFVGALLVVLFNIMFMVAGVWLMVGLKFSVWNFYFLATILSILFAFASLYSLSALASVITKNSILSIILSYIIFMFLSPILAARENLNLLFKSDIIKIILDGLYYLIPKTSELGLITANIAVGTPINDYQPIISTLLFIILIFSTSIFIFNKKDY